MSNRIAILTLVLTIGFDQLSKDAAHLFGFTVFINTGISFSLFPSLSVEAISAFLLVLTVLLWYGFQSFWREHSLVAGLFFGGGLSNILDRVLYGGVRDWLVVPGLMVQGNLADWAIGGAVVVLGVGTIFRSFRERTHADAET